MNSKQIQKDHIRRTVLLLRRSIKSNVYIRKNAAIYKKLHTLSLLHTADTICVYFSLADEVGTHAVISDLLKKGKTICIPKITDSSLTLYKITTLSDLKISKMGIYEPVCTSNQISGEQIDVFIIPGIAFDRYGTRIGWGKGYYDKLLTSVTQPKIGLAFSEQIFPLLPRENHDIVMDIIVTEKEIIRIHKNYEKNASTP